MRAFVAGALSLLAVPLAACATGAGLQGEGRRAMLRLGRPNGETRRPHPFFVSQWFWVIPRRSARSGLIALVLALPAAWLFARWLPWPLAVLFLGAQLAYCAARDALDDWVYSLAVGALTFWYVWTRYAAWPESAWGAPRIGALAAASAVSAAFIGWRRYGRTGRPLLDDERD